MKMIRLCHKISFGDIRHCAQIKK